MSDIKETIYYKELRAGDIIQKGDEWWPKDGTGQWQAYHQGMFGLQVLDASIARRPIRATHQTTFEEVPGTRTLQQAVEQPQRERIAYEELQPGDVIQEGDESQHENGRWHPFTSLVGSCVQVRHTQRARRPYKISTLLEIGDALANAQKAATQLQDERDEARKALTQMLAQLTNQTEVLTEVRADEKRLFDDLELLRSEYIKLQAERDNAQAALKSAQRARDELQRQVDELRADRERLQGLIDNLLDEPTAKRVYKMLEDMLDQTEWVGQCLDSSTYEQMSCIQRTIANVAERVRNMVKEGASADA